MEIEKFMLCAISAAALDICALVLMIAAYREKSTGKKRWDKISSGMELAETGAAYPLECDEVLIGRHGSADVRLPDLSVSRYHAMMTVSDGVWTITDMGSKSGVYVNGTLTKQRKLHENDIILIGNRRLIFRKRREKNDR